VNKRGFYNIDADILRAYDLFVTFRPFEGFGVAAVKAIGLSSLFLKQTYQQVAIYSN
jgi:hypothetical protein